MKILLALLMLLATPVIHVDQANATAQEQLARDLTTYFRAARAVISSQQKHINNPNVGDKGLSGEKVVQFANANYRKITGHHFDNTSKEAKMMQNAIRTVMAKSQHFVISSLNIIPEAASPAMVGQRVSWILRHFVKRVEN